MLKYARADTHFLLYVYDNLQNALLDRAVSRGVSPTNRTGSPTASDTFVREVLSRSAETALCGYSPDPYDAEDMLARQWNKPTLCVDAEPTVQRKVFRSEDESTA
ncbi:hypothetical protein EDB89DRAFT_2006662 [Lactarius sanguifluus]|nr:hypothetical protein EDB89DRAFT_2006662 [Lactarius sanguifluus]